MSRSRKKHAGYVDRNPFMKNYANRRLRRIPVDSDILSDRKWYRRYSCTYDICDWVWIYHSWQECLDSWAVQDMSLRRSRRSEVEAKAEYKRLARK